MQAQPVNMWQKEVDLDSITNGLQFAPQTESSIIKAYDSLYQRPFEYGDKSEISLYTDQGAKISAIEYKERLTSGANGDNLAQTPQGTISFGAAANVDLVASRKEL